MKEVTDYCNKVRKKTEKLLKRMFGYKSIKIAISEKKKLVNELESLAGKSIYDFTMQDVRKDVYKYAKWRTLDRILSIYLDLVSLDKFIIKELENGY